ncbi:hypothetical protein OVY01_09840 [Robbsia sp. Bb-Pol-6]|uniref:ATP-grasp domain-containing protein n=1 Tax=Robbsia betulipollinis TaxID=2981849 RepID=A0ABT3ZLU7_9BURK|nr:hypothetical protein [Robbsia betulipollinis]MCY0387531.1 hypothetical protein [Robbsia betulipollinis]
MPAITLLFGGRSVENRTSCRMYEHVRECLLEARPDDISVANVIGIAPNGKLRASGPRDHDGLPPAPQLLARGREISAAAFVDTLCEDGDFVFSLLQGQDGEDGTFQGLARFFDFPDNAGSTLSAALAFDKFAQACVVEKLAGDLLAPLETVLVSSSQPGGAVRETVQRFGKRPVLLKPNAAGGSFKILPLDLLIDEEIERYANEIAPFDDHFLIQERIDGVEIVVGMVCAAGQRQLLPVFELKPPVRAAGVRQGEPVPGGGRIRRLPADDPLAMQACRAAERIARTFRDETYCRLDFLAGRDGRLRFLEAGTRPGLSRSSVFPMMLEAHGMGLLDLIRQEFENHAASRAFRRQRIARIAEWVCANA